MKTISLGVGDKLYEGLWTRSGNKEKGRVIFRFREQLPAPYNTKEVKIEYTNWNKYIPYQLGGKMVNRILECEK